MGLRRPSPVRRTLRSPSIGPDTHLPLKPTVPWRDLSSAYPASHSLNKKGAICPIFRKYFCLVMRSLFALHYQGGYVMIPPIR